MNYWIIESGATCGPYDTDQIIQMNLAPDTPIWRQGLSDWTTLSQLPEYDRLTHTSGSYTQTVSGFQPEPAEETVAEETFCNNTSTSRRTDEAPTYFGWCIAAMLCCCTPIGIGAVIQSIRVRNANERQDYDLAWRRYRNLELWLIATIVLGILAFPISFMTQFTALI